MDLPAVSTRSALRGSGIDDAHLRRLIRRRDLVRVGYDRYAAPGLVLPAEVIALADPAVALSHASAARAWGLPVDDGTVTVVIPEHTRRRALPPGVSVVRARAWEVTTVRGLRVTTLPRTLADLAMTTALEVSVPALDVGLRDTSVATVLAEVSPYAPGRQRLRRALDLADTRAESPLESRLRLD